MSWQTIPAGELMVKRGGSVNPANFPCETFELLSIPAFDTGSPELRKGEEIGSSKSCVLPGDVLLSKIVPHIRRCWVVPRPKGEYRQIGSGEWIIFRSGKIFPPFLKHYLVSDVFHKQFMNTTAGVGGSLVRARPAGVERIEIPLPPLAEQKRIAAILDKTDAIRRKRQQAIQLADEFLRAVFLDMFGRYLEEGWEISTVEGVAASSKNSMRTGPFGSQLLHSEFVESGVCVLGIDNVVDNKFKWGKPRFIAQEKYEELKRYTVNSGDVLISIMGTCGRCAIVPDEIPLSINTKHLCCISLNRNRCLPEYLQAYFLFHSLAEKYLNATTKGAIMDGLNMGIIKEMPIPVPPIDMQKKYSEIKKMKDSLLSKMVDYGDRTMFESLSSAAFSGEL